MIKKQPGFLHLIEVIIGQKPNNLNITNIERFEVLVKESFEEIPLYKDDYSNFYSVIGQRYGLFIKFWQVKNERFINVSTHRGVAICLGLRIAYVKTIDDLVIKKLKNEKYYLEIVELFGDEDLLRQTFNLLRLDRIDICQKINRIFSEEKDLLEKSSRVTNG